MESLNISSQMNLEHKYKSLLRQDTQNYQGHVPLEDSGHREKQSPLYSENLKTARACRDFEALFIQQMLKEMRKGLKENTSFGVSSASENNQNGFFRDKMYANIATDLANQATLGIGSMLFEQIHLMENQKYILNDTAVLPHPQHSKALQSTPSSHSKNSSLNQIKVKQSYS